MKRNEAGPTTGNETGGYDFIGDIHGCAGALEALLEKLGYEKGPSSWAYPAGRKVVFLGDYIDRGPAIRETLHLVKDMVDAGEAFAIMGNHEYNAVCYHTEDGNGGHLRPHSEKNREQHQATLDAFEGRDEEWESWLDWFKSLPFHLDLNGSRAVHATWDDEKIAFLRDKSLHSRDFLFASATRQSKEFEAIETVLKGRELELPDGEQFEDKSGILRRNIRVRWWERLKGKTYREAVFPYSESTSDSPIPHPIVRDWGNYPEGEPPVFFGHYALLCEGAMTPEAENIACLDYGMAKEGKLVAYRWDGEAVLSPEKFVTAE